MYCGDYYGEDEVRVMFFRLSFATKEIKEKIRQYIIEAKYEIDEEDFLKLLDMNDIEKAYEYYDDLDTAAREHFFMILEKFDKELTSSMLARVFNISELMLVKMACKDEISNLKDARNRVESFGSITKPIDTRISDYEMLLDFFNESIKLKDS